MVNKEKGVYKNHLEMVTVRLVKDAPLMSKTPIRTLEDAVRLLGEYLCQMDREVICVINLNAIGVPVNCSVCNVGIIAYQNRVITGKSISENRNVSFVASVLK